MRATFWGCADKMLYYDDKRERYKNKQPWDFPAAIGKYDNLYPTALAKVTKAIRGQGNELINNDRESQAVRLTDADKPR